MIALKALLNRLSQQQLLHEVQGPAIDNIDIDHVADDSRMVGLGGLFVAVRGAEVDGHLFIDKTVKNGAIAIVCEAVPEDARLRHPGTVFARVSDTRAALAEIAAAFFGDPSRLLRMIGVTGTNGKTTTTFLIHAMLERLGVRAGLLGTVTVRIGREDLPSALTTPGSLELQQLLRRMVDSGCDACVMEVSSHALSQQRTRALEYEAAAFTNLSQDHLDYHQTFEDYFRSKKILFDQLPSRATALFNTDDARGTAIVSDSAGARVSFGMSGSAAIRFEIVANEIAGLTLNLDGHRRRFRLVGRFNAYNLAAAYGVGLALGFSGEEVIDALAEAPPVTGRFEQLSFSDDRTAIIDYAHTPDALENVLSTIIETKGPGARLWCIFGCGGDRDPGKRPLMGEVVERLADEIIVTNDNPRTESPGAILDDIRRGIRNPGRAHWITDRREAIAFAAEHAAAGDVVLVAGKGHEAYQIIGTKKYPFDDRKEVINAFSHRAGALR
jgi:UDP-N-acetylmuramoyl-L-alanyl-D-glutamate--2,6-diaminopimelate ligase